MNVIKAWTNRKSALIGFVVIIAVILWPAAPLRGLDVWFQTLIGLFPTNILYPIMAVLIGSYVALYMYSRESKTCKINPAAGTSASFVGVLFGACPACIPALAFFLPLSATVTLSYFSWAFLAVSIGIIIFALYRMGGFKGG